MSRGLTYLSMLSPTILNVFKCEASGPNTSQELELICDERGEYSGVGDYWLMTLSWKVHFLYVALLLHLGLPFHQPALVPGVHLSPAVLN